MWSSVGPAAGRTQDAARPRARHLFGNPNPAATVHAWPMQHPELAVAGWAQQAAGHADRHGQRTFHGERLVLVG